MNTPHITMQAPGVPLGERQERFARVLRHIGRSGLLGVLILLCVVAAFISPGFLQPANLVNVLRQVALYGVISVGMTFVILTAGIDLSVGATLGIVAILFTKLLNAGVSPLLAGVLGLAIGGFVGLLNGLGISRGRIPAFIMTLGMMVMAGG